ncbi:MAG: hypothetical protein ACFB2W_15385 [Leptolyngbyaceae cyanobacterium]
MTSQYQAASHLLSVGMIFVFVSACQTQTAGESAGSDALSEEPAPAD